MQDEVNWLDCQTSPKPVNGKSTTSLKQLSGKLSSKRNDCGTWHVGDITKTANF